MARLIGNKWYKYKFMKQYDSLAPYLPKTRKLTKDDLWKMIDRYGDAIVKPVNGSRGRGVIQVTELKHRRYELHYENRKTVVDGKDRVNKYIRQKIGSRPYIVQWRVPRAEVNGRPFDLRVVVQRHKDSKHWKVTGKIAKVAGKGYIVSNNTRSKGQLLHVDAAIERSTITHKHGVISKVERVALKSAEKLGKLYKKHRIFGFDIGLERDGHIWIIEANLLPAMSHFLKLGDKRMVRRIRAYKRG